jgi:hypothetical protein
MFFTTKAVDDFVELIFGIARRLPVVSAAESFFVAADAVKTAVRLKNNNVE